MKLVVLESPFAGDIEGNIAYAKRCIRDSLKRGEAPIASHLLYTQPGILKDEVPEERKLGINAGLAWTRVADLQAFYTDRGWSSGMLAALHERLKTGRLSNVAIRCIEGGLILPTTLDEEVERWLESCIGK